MKKSKTLTSMMTVVLGGSMVFTACSSSDDAINDQLVYNEA